MSGQRNIHFDRRVMHEDFCAYAEILGLVASHAPHALSIAELHQYTQRPSQELRLICMHLARAKLLAPQDGVQSHWILKADPADVTLADVYLCLLDVQAEPPPNKNTLPPRPAGRGRILRALDLLMMQATLEINQSVQKHLRSFSLSNLNLSPTNSYARRKLFLVHSEGAGTAGQTPSGAAFARRRRK